MKNEHCSVAVVKLFNDVPHHPALAITLTLESNLIISLRYQRRELIDYKLNQDGTLRMRKVNIAKDGPTRVYIYNEVGTDSFFISQELHSRIMKAIALSLVIESWQ